MEPSSRNQWQSAANGLSAKNRENRRNPLPWVATGCHDPKMVRRGSTVRVRQRALGRRKSPEIGDCCCPAKHRRAPLITSRPLSSSLRSLAKHLQIGHLPATTEHLREAEGLRGQDRRPAPKTAGYGTSRRFPSAPFDDGDSDDGRFAGHPRRMKMGSAAALRSAKLGTAESEDSVAPGALRDSELCREHVDQTLD
jgi:hypothetical protein